MSETPAGDRVGRVVDAWRRECPGVDVSSIGIITPLWRLAGIVLDERTRTLAEHGLEQSQLDVLGALRRSGRPYRLTAGELSRRCRVTPGATTQRVQVMERLGLVERVREEPDRRTVHVQLTPAGHERLDGVLGDVMAADEALLARLGAAQRETLEGLLRTWLDLLEPGMDERPAAGAP